jgi:hypothetical protein
VTITIPAYANTGPTSTGTVGLKVQPSSASDGTYVPVVVLDADSDISIGAVSQEGTWTVGLASGSSTIGGVLSAPTSSASFAIPPGSSPALAASHILKASAGNLYSLYVLSTSVAGYLMTFNATSVPANGAVTPIECIPVYADSFAEIDFSGAPPDYYSTGIVAVFSTTGPFTLTASATAFFKWRVQ